MIGTLSIVATPIGNLSDMTFRAVDTLKTADIVLCEDTRVTKKLLSHYQIETPTMSYHQHSTEKKVKDIERMLSEGKHLALVTDAGTPGISDPGNRLISELRARNEDISIVPIPGPSAVVAALSISGFPTDSFTFLGFPPHKKKRKKFFETVSKIKHTVALYESSHRIDKTLHELAEVLDSKRTACVCRELTKKFESVYRGTFDELLAMDLPEKGEFVIIINGR